MPSKKGSKTFEWESGNRLTEDLYDPLGKVRETGFTRLADGIYADPKKRKQARGTKLSRPTRHPVKPPLLVEESESGLHKEITPSEASRLIRKENRGIRGIWRFKKGGSPKNPPK